MPENWMVVDSAGLRKPFREGLKTAFTHISFVSVIEMVGF
jgi:hypothetical protein